MAHTPGPWVAYDFGANWWVAAPDADDSGPMLRVGGLHKEREANARLIAAAPDLLEALEYVMSAHGEQLTDAFEKAKAAIDKARGTNTSGN